MLEKKCCELYSHLKNTHINVLIIYLTFSSVPSEIILKDKLTTVAKLFNSIAIFSDKT